RKDRADAVGRLIGNVVKEPVPGLVDDCGAGKRREAQPVPEGQAGSGRNVDVERAAPDVDDAGRGAAEWTALPGVAVPGHDDVALADSEAAGGDVGAVGEDDGVGLVGVGAGGEDAGVARADVAPERSGCPA